MRSVEHPESNQKRIIKIVFSLFIGLLLVFTLYSNTLLTMNLPKVWVEEGRSDPLIQNYSDSGVLQPISEVELSNKAGWMVKNILVEVGDRVTKGQTLVTYQSREAEQRILDEEANLARQRLMMEGLQDRYIEAVQSDDELILRSAKRDIEIARLEMGVQERKMRILQEDFESLRLIAAPFNGRITKVAAVEGLPSDSSGQDVLLSHSNLGFQLSLHIPSSIVDQLEIGNKQNVDVKIKGVTQSIEGIVTAIENVEAVNTDMLAGDTGDSNTTNPKPHKLVKLTVQSTELQGGEQASIELSKSSTAGEGILLSNKAIHGEGSNKYIFVMEEKKSPLGNTFHARKELIEVGEANEDEAIVLSGAYPGQLIIVESSEPLQDGSRVRPR